MVTVHNIIHMCSYKKEKMLEFNGLEYKALITKDKDTFLIRIKELDICTFGINEEEAIEMAYDLISVYTESIK